MVPPPGAAAGGTRGLLLGPWQPRTDLKSVMETTQSQHVTSDLNLDQTQPSSDDVFADRLWDLGHGAFRSFSAGDFSFTFFL